MREIKFRAWNKDDSLPMFNPFTTGLLFQTILQAPSVDLMQYTGLKDKNGVEIYEGDIMQTSTGPHKVIYEAGCFWLGDDKNIFRAVLYLYAESDAAWIIGNIHENPELFKK